MSYSETLANKIRTALSHLPDVKEKKMFGGLAFMVNDKMCITAGPGRIMCRIDPALHEEALKKKACRPVIMKGREYKGFVHVNEEGVKNKKDFDYWIGLALAYNKTARASKK
ncbi:MAG TPA: TfoX/Sxy family protein [Chitinophagaceae bacterium]|nr:TfoX/Sxy family protein [Chitinophagaceae bacterium]